MSNYGHRHPGVFTIMCCGWRRSVLPGDVIVCTKCDYTINEGLTTVIPNEARFTDISSIFRVWRVPPIGPR